MYQALCNCVYTMAGMSRLEAIRQYCDLAHTVIDEYGFIMPEGGEYGRPVVLAKVGAATLTFLAHSFKY